VDVTDFKPLQKLLQKIIEKEDGAFDLVVDWLVPKI